MVPPTPYDGIGRFGLVDDHNTNGAAGRPRRARTASGATVSEVIFGGAAAGAALHAAPPTADEPAVDTRKVEYLRAVVDDKAGSADAVAAEFEVSERVQCDAAASQVHSHLCTHRAWSALARKPSPLIADAACSRRLPLPTASAWQRCWAARPPSSGLHLHHLALVLLLPLGLAPLQLQQAAPVPYRGACSLMLPTAEGAVALVAQPRLHPLVPPQ